MPRKRLRARPDRIMGMSEPVLIGRDMPSDFPPGYTWPSELSPAQERELAAEQAGTQQKQAPAQQDALDPRAVVACIQNMQENVRRLQQAVDGLGTQQAPAPVQKQAVVRGTRFIGGQGISLIQRKDFVQIDTIHDPSGILYEITAVDPGVDCTVRRVLTDGSLLESSEVTGVLYQPGLPVAVGDQGQLVRLADNALAFVKDYPWLWQVTAVGDGTCTVQMVDASGDPVEATEFADVLYDTLPVVGDNCLLARRTDGSFSIVQWPYKTIVGYNAATTQILTHVSGILTWKNTTPC